MGFVQPTVPGFYWAKLVTPSGMPEGEDWASLEWGVVEVWDNNGEGDEALAVSVPGVPVTQWPKDFIWGPMVPQFNGFESKAVATRLLTEDESFLVEAAMHHGFEFANDEGTVFLAHQDAIVSLLKVHRDRRHMINYLIDDCHNASVRCGWYHDPVTGEPIERNVPEMMCLVHSEISEGMEAYRKDLMDDKLPDFHGTTVELVDGLIRIFDLLGYLKGLLAERYGPRALDGGLAYLHKRNFNDHRADHKPENRAKTGGKKF